MESSDAGSDFDADSRIDDPWQEVDWQLKLLAMPVEVRRFANVIMQCIVQHMKYHIVFSWV